MKVIDRFKQSAILSRLVSTDAWRRLLAEDRATNGERRAEMVAGMDAARVAGEARRKAAATALATAQAAFDDAAAEYRRAEAVLRQATTENLGAHSGADAAVYRIARQLRESADPRIANVLDHVLALENAAGLAARAVSETITMTALGPRREETWNTDAVIAMRAVLRGLADELRQLQVSDYGADVRPYLEHVLTRARAAAAPLGLFGGDVGQVPDFELED